MGGGLMRDEPQAEILLQQARKTLLEKLLPSLPESRRYEALMVASAMAMAAREVAAEDRSVEEEAALRKLAPSMEGLAAAIRAGEKDGDAEVHRFLYGEAATRLAISENR